MPGTRSARTSTTGIRHSAGKHPPQLLVTLKARPPAPGFFCGRKVAGRQRVITPLNSQAGVVFESHLRSFRRGPRLSANRRACFVRESERESIYERGERTRWSGASPGWFSFDTQRGSIAGLSIARRLGVAAVARARRWRRRAAFVGSVSCLEARMKRCHYCGGPFGLIRHRHFWKRFCRKRCKENYLTTRARKIAADRPAAGRVLATDN